MRQHAKFELEEVPSIGVFELFRLVDLSPEVFDICVDQVLNSLLVVTSVIEISNNKEKFFG